MNLDHDKAIDLVRSVSGPINTLGWQFYFDKHTLARGREVGLDGFRFYILGRGGVLGDVDAPVVASALGYFNPALIDKMWNSARQRLEPRAAARHYMECCAEWGRRNLGQTEDLTAFNEAADAVIGAVDPAGLALYAGVAALPRVEDPSGRAAQQLAVLREHRGSVHLVCVVASRLSPAVAHAINRPDDTELFGWSSPPSFTQEDVAALDAANLGTDEVVAAAFGVLSTDQALALRAVARWL